MLSRDSGIEAGELIQAMKDRAMWHSVVADLPTSDAGSSDDNDNEESYDINQTIKIRKSAPRERLETLQLRWYSTTAPPQPEPQHFGQ
ncbi:hypothetical protein AC249_AIPGENE20227 [Exaiptasia diaphana]|nr:hypothetical protein AC249_AIPGENE20227 [Exaiptasia diaphana]